MSREYEKQEALRMTGQNANINSNGDTPEPYINEIIQMDTNRNRRRTTEPDSRGGR